MIPLVSPFLAKISSAFNAAFLPPPGVEYLSFPETFVAISVQSQPPFSAGGQILVPRFEKR